MSATTTRPAAADSGRPGSSTSAVAGPTTLSLAKAITAALHDAMAADEKVLLMGEDIGRLGGVFRITDGLQATFGEDRVVDTPLAEASILGTAIGLALRGYRPVCEIQFDGFVYPAFSQIVSQLAKMPARMAGTAQLPVVVRIPYGGGIGAVEHHSESPEAYFAHTAGLRVISPATPQDAYWMLRQALTQPDPVIVMEPKRRYWEKGSVDTSAEALRTAPGLHSARVARPVNGARASEGGAVTVVAYGPTVRVALDAALAAAEEGVELEVIDLRSLSPLDIGAVEASARRTGRVVVVHEAPVFLGTGAEIAARVTESCFHSLEAPVLRVGGFAVPYPAARIEEHYLPDAERLLDAVDRVLA
ncbi:pyruvate dehydrogenase E1 component beta subunit [Quadrisphaera granulorum]|uniref:3-methyl-2-oxobutanoate dehydrogenase (2-methylpropanoyl-transferring) n=1 Tax=Quadrisphaera granulorum TaxID=317664 RepID=A0A316AEM8_9ACTN|nr:transketolase C-terminal domain-containing protein [Quadrisphaera granulorum]PWJ55819.1 pyruvate dehydrogenase E1 component beta subunit [Quadrisphaera granulorum]SZE95316.1 pyruvate dehydrogenase E1 component beta subunit [Quadrisphaera granulorum]